MNLTPRTRQVSQHHQKVAASNADRKGITQETAKKQLWQKKLNLPLQTVASNAGKMVTIRETAKRVDLGVTDRARQLATSAAQMAITHVTVRTADTEAEEEATGEVEVATVAEEEEASVAEVEEKGTATTASNQATWLETALSPRSGQTTKYQRASEVSEEMRTFLLQTGAMQLPP